jgi:hypothetical protein
MAKPSDFAGLFLIENMPGAFISKLPQNLATAVQGQYDLLYPIFEKYAKSEGNQYYTLIRLNYEFSCFLLEMALFYKNVIVPMARGSQAFVNLNGTSIRTVKVGNYVLSPTDRHRIRNIEREFDRILSKYNIPVQLLLFSDVKEFARSLNTFFEQQQYV